MSTEREEFEQWASSEMMNVSRSTPGADTYAFGNAQFAWDVWQAALAREKAEPVAWRYKDQLGNWHYWIGSAPPPPTDLMRTPEPLYTHPTAPAEADERPLE